jgi:phosphoglycolate phosphatase-like HAD superfamily hydrolase
MSLVIFDLDGTLCDISHRRWMIGKNRLDGRPPDWPGFYRACADDVPKTATIEVARALHSAGHELWLFSGRSDEVIVRTMTWLEKHGLSGLFTRFRFRATGDYTPDDKLKYTWYEEMTPMEKIRLMLVFDDRDRMVKMWRSLGVPCFQVDEGDF